MIIALLSIALVLLRRTIIALIWPILLVVLLFVVLLLLVELFGDGNGGAGKDEGLDESHCGG